MAAVVASLEYFGPTWLYHIAASAAVVCGACHINGHPVCQTVTVVYITRPSLSSSLSSLTRRDFKINPVWTIVGPQKKGLWADLTTLVETHSKERVQFLCKIKKRVTGTEDTKPRSEGCFGFNRQEIVLNEKRKWELQAFWTHGAKQNKLPWRERSRLPRARGAKAMSASPMITERGGRALASCLGVYGHAAWLLLEDGSRSDPNGFNEELFTCGRGALKILQEKLCISIHLPFGR